MKHKKGKITRPSGIDGAMIRVAGDAGTSLTDGNAFVEIQRTTPDWSYILRGMFSECSDSGTAPTEGQYSKSRSK